MGRSFNYDQAAAALVEAAYYGDEQAAKEYDVSRRTIRRWRNRMDEDDDLAALVAAKKQQFEDSWADELPAAIRASIEFLGRAARNGKVHDTDSIRTIAGSLKILADVALTKKVLDARLTGRGEPERTEDRSVARDDTPS